MKQKLLFTIALAVTLVYKSQTVTPVVLSNQGGFSALSGGSVSWTIGEPVSETYTTATKITTMGFHQPELSIITLIAEQGADQNILVYPNPVKDVLTVNFSGLKAGTYNLELLDGIGKLIFKTETTISATSQTYQLKVNEVAAGNYFLKVDNANFSKTVKINKVY